MDTHLHISMYLLLMPACNLYAYIYICAHTHVCVCVYILYHFIHYINSYKDVNLRMRAFSNAHVRRLTVNQTANGYIIFNKA